MPWRDMVICNKASNFLTDTLSRKLHAFLRKEDNGDDELLESVLRKIKEVASSDPTKCCIICGTEFETTVWRPLPCSKDACRKELTSWSLETRISPFLRTPKVLDLLLTCVYTSQPSSFGTPVVPLSLIPGFTWTEMRNIIDAFPKITDETTLSDLMLAGGQRVAKEKLLSWLCTEFEGTIVPAPPSSQVGFSESEQFLVLNGPVKRELEVERTFGKINPNSREKHSTGGQAAFHGTPHANLFSILHSGLLNMDPTWQVWYAAEPSYSLGFNLKNASGVEEGILTGPKQSAYMGMTLLFGVEAVTTSILQSGQIYNSNETTVAIRNIFVLLQRLLHTRLPNIAPEAPPDGLALRTVMKKTIDKIRSGEIVKYL